MKTDLSVLKTVIRQWPEGDYIALYPDWSAGGARVQSYCEKGGHGGADYHEVIRQTRPANLETPEAATFLINVQRAEANSNADGSPCTIRVVRRARPTRNML
jgi:hypothetical protein